MWKEAYEYKKISATVKSKINSINKEKLISELRIKFNAQFDHEKLELLQNQNKLQKNVIIQEKLKQNYLWVVLILGLTLFIIIFTAYRNQSISKKRLYKLSTTDYLTNVANRRQIIKKLMKLHQLNIEQQIPFSIVMIDLDHFKKINDTYGHDVGNEVLIHFAQSAEKVLQSVGDVGRIGGEEWLLLLPETGINQVKIILKELREVYIHQTLSTIPHDCALSFSSGILKCNGQYDNYEKLLTDVDTALYQAKSKGRHQDVYI
jgi:diguanylate cyclase (GGDEF)-like protein